MSYEKTIWTAGDVITAEKLNNIENGIEAADKPTYSPEAVTGEGDVSIVYNGNQIGVLSESGTLMLDTDGKVVQHDIEVEYTKPSGTAIGNTVNLSTDIVDEQIVIHGDFLQEPEFIPKFLLPNTIIPDRDLCFVPTRPVDMVY